MHHYTIMFVSLNSSFMLETRIHFVFVFHLLDPVTEFWE